MTMRPCAAVAGLLLLAAALPTLAREQPTVRLGQSAAQVQAVLGQPEWTWTLGSKRVLGFPELKVALVNDKVTEIHLWQSCEAQGRGAEAGCRRPGADALVQPVPRP